MVSRRTCCIQLYATVLERASTSLPAINARAQNTEVTHGDFSSKMHAMVSELNVNMCAAN
eukprot:11196429-Lingulodinium_polyedra.AAC.1